MRHHSRGSITFIMSQSTQNVKSDKGNSSLLQGLQQNFDAPW